MPMTKNPFNGQLNSNEIFAAIYNMIISQQVFADNIKEGFGLVSKYKTDGTMYGDTKLFYSTDVLETHDWLGDNEAANLLSLDRPEDPDCQAITIDTYRQIRLTVDNYLSKKAWGDEGAFGNFQSVMLGWIGKTKEVYDNTLINTYVGTKADKSETVTLAAASDIDDYALRALLIGEKIADLALELKDYNREFNGYGHLRNYNIKDFTCIWNGKYRNEIRKVDLPTIFHNDGIVEKLDEEVLPSRYFGSVVTLASESEASTTSPRTKPISIANGVYTYDGEAGDVLHFGEECDVAVLNSTDSKYYVKHFFAGDAIPVGAVVQGTVTVQLKTVSGKYRVAQSGTSSFVVSSAPVMYKEEDKVICKLVHNDAIKYMSAFQVATEFFNQRSLTENHYLTFGYGLDKLVEYPIITISEVAAS